jgi:hypothetical protein
MTNPTPTPDAPPPEWNDPTVELDPQTALEDVRRATKALQKRYQILEAKLSVVLRKDNLDELDRRDRDRELG